MIRQFSRKPDLPAVCFNSLADVIECQVPTHLARAHLAETSFQTIQLTTTTCVTPLASIQLPSGGIVELRHDPNMIYPLVEA